MPIHLSVVEPFEDYQRGHIITDEQEVARVAASHHVHRVVRLDHVVEEDRAEG